MTRQQLKALHLLTYGARLTSKTTAHGYIAGATMRGLLARGWAKRQSAPWATTSSYVITNEGRAAYEAETKKREGA